MSPAAAGKLFARSATGRIRRGEHDKKGEATWQIEPRCNVRCLSAAKDPLTHRDTLFSAGDSGHYSA
ncbi:MAG: hypothetical protein QOH24_1289 [Verrucomicrobiota bacterium]